MMNEEYRNETGKEEPRVMSREDVHEYRGLTLNESGEEERKEAPHTEMGGFHVHVFSPSAMPWWKKALFWAPQRLWWRCFLWWRGSSCWEASLSPALRRSCISSNAIWGGADRPVRKGRDPASIGCRIFYISINGKFSIK